MPFDLPASLKIIAASSKSPEISGVLYLAADESKRLQEIETAVRDCVTAAPEEKRAAWEKVKELCRVSGDE